ncbi:MAG: hypothetical protein ACXWZI_12135 [Mycobacterium sp.]
MSRDDEPNWQDQKPVVWSAGVAALILVALLFCGVMCTSDSSKVPETVPLPTSTSSATPSTYTTSSTSTTSYRVPRVQTSEDNPVNPVNPVGPGPG